LKTSSHYAQNSAAVNEISKEITNIKSQLESWRKRLNEAGALENVVVNVCH
jgi:transposase-like protein